MKLVIAICGMAGAGKSELRGYFQKKGFEYVHLGVTEMAKEKHGYTSEELEKKLRKEVRREHGMGAMAILFKDRIDGYLQSNKHVVVDNMYSWSEYKEFKKNYGSSFVSIAIHASPKTRYERLKTRNDGRDYSEPSVTKSRDYDEIENLEKGGPIAMADFHIINEEITKDELLEKASEIYKKIRNFYNL